MPTDTIKIAGKVLDKKVVYYGGAIAAGVVGYAYWRNSRDTGPEFLTANPDLAAVSPPTDNTGFSVYGTDKPPQTNAEWFAKVLSVLQSYGIDAAAVSSAIGKFLGKQPLTKAERDLVQQALAAAGQPPQGGPYTIIEIPSGGVKPPIVIPPGTIVTPPPVQTPPQPTPAPGPPPTPTNFKAGGATQSVFLAWDPSPGATWYEYLRMTAAGNDTPWINVGGQTAILVPQHVSVDTQYAYAVRAGGPGGYSGAAHSNSTWITR